MAEELELPADEVDVLLSDELLLVAEPVEDEDADPVLVELSEPVLTVPFVWDPPALPVEPATPALPAATPPVPAATRVDMVLGRTDGVPAGEVAAAD